MSTSAIGGPMAPTPNTGNGDGRVEVDDNAGPIGDFTRGPQGLDKVIFRLRHGAQGPLQGNFGNFPCSLRCSFVDGLSSEESNFIDWAVVLVTQVTKTTVDERGVD
ncbi:hypothetical protein BS47DRAFT_1361986 [Hydnum rufescens UP504]|uniref:Uncharacterized protein n=1 Tax=Hydnum rufescens UP504 TaxID=1448309 RepID=A0A9P6AXW3_9AGAM|nr:hypothetical protein BS47DRAFT_1361986 [Hydnum rufescens UP504]